MSAMPSPTESAEFPVGPLPIKPPAEAPALRPADLRGDLPAKKRRSPFARGVLAFIRFVIMVCIGVAGTVAWQTYGDTAREMIANASPQLAWLAPQAAPAAQNSPDVIAPVGASADQAQPVAVSPDFDAVRENVDRIAAGQDQITRSLSQLAASQEQMAREIAKLQAIEQYILYKQSEPPSPSRPATAPAPAAPPKPAARPPQTPPPVR